MDGAILESAYLTKTIDEAKSITGADFTEAVMPSCALALTLALAPALALTLALTLQPQP